MADAHREALINSLVIRCFRDMGDNDYIGARAMYRAHLPSQFLWSAQQAVEKYLKCILVLNRVSSKGLSHEIQKALNRINTDCPFKIELNRIERSIFDHLAMYGENRYLEISYHVHDKELLKLDQLVWHLRQYCRPLNTTQETANGTIFMLQPMLDMIKRSWDGKASAGHLPTGKLEGILRKKDHPSREALVWKNMRYASVDRQRVAWKNWMSAENAPLWLNPELLDDVLPLIQVDKQVAEAYRQLAQLPTVLVQSGSEHKVAELVRSVGTKDLVAVFQRVDFAIVIELFLTPPVGRGCRFEIN